MGSASSLPNLFGRALNDIDSLRYHYSVARALHRGQEWQPDQPRRPSLPSELVLYIFRLCDLPRRDPSPAFRLHWLEESTVEGEEGTPFTVSAGWGGERKNGLWCTTPRLSQSYLEQLHKFRLRTLSKDQGWCSNPSHGSWSWFEIGIVQRPAAGEADAPSPEEIEVEVSSDAWGLSRRDSDEEAELDPSTGKPLRWLSHRNEISTREFKLHIGDDIGLEHEIWEHLRPGDRLGVWMSAQFGGWSCSSKQAEIEIWERWQPSWM
ncbi:hypothetical protein FRB95_001813 [Tulasnella sp. JGI-2019a]|nr:hypothetical protein FRB95_001813 [Tulasnella sp. JGI-2019a]